MKDRHSIGPDNGDAEFAMLRTIYPFLAAMGIGAVVWHFGGFASQATLIDQELARISKVLAWVSLLMLPALGLSILAANPPRMKLSLARVLRTAIEAALLGATAVWLVFLSGKV